MKKSKKSKEKMCMFKNPLKIGIFAGVALLLLIILNPFFAVGIGQVAVVFNSMTGHTRTCDQGFHFKIPMIDHVTKFDVRTAKIDYKAEGASKDLQAVTFELALNYHLDYKKVNQLYNTVGKDFLSRVVEPSVMEIVKACASRYPVEQIIVAREQLKKDIETELITKLSNYYIIVEGLNIVDIDFTPEFNKIVEEKQIEEQKIKTAQYVRLQAEENKKTEILKAEAEATKQRLLQQSATREVVSLKWIEKWNGQLPTYMMGDGGALIQIPSK